MKTKTVQVNTKANEFIHNLSPELKSAIISIGETIRPLLDDIHANPPMTQNYYGDYLRLLSYKPERAKLLALAMLYEGANPQGLQAAVSFATGNELRMPLF